jgi:hypothetical protein
MCAASGLDLARRSQLRRSAATSPERERPSRINRRNSETAWCMMTLNYQKSAVPVKTRVAVEPSSAAASLSHQ